MKKVLIIDTNRRFLSDIQSRIILSDVEGLEIEVSAMVDNIQAEVDRLKPDELVIPSYLSDVYSDWDIGVSVRCFARDDEGVLEATDNGLPCYGIIADSKELLDVIEKGEVMKIKGTEQPSVPMPEALPETPAEPQERVDEPVLEETEDDTMDDLFMNQTNNMAMNQMNNMAANQMNNAAMYDQMETFQRQVNEHQQREYEQAMTQKTAKQASSTGERQPDTGAPGQGDPQQPGQPYMQNPQGMPYPYPPYPMFDANGNPIPQMFDAQGNPIPVMYDANGNPMPAYYPGMQGQNGAFNPYMYPYPPYMMQGQDGQTPPMNPYYMQQFQMQQDMEHQQRTQQEADQKTQKSAPIEKKKTVQKPEPAPEQETDDLLGEQPEEHEAEAQKPKKRKWQQRGRQDGPADMLDRPDNAKKRGNSSNIIEEQLAIDLGNKKGPAKVITVYSAKGGVGKTTIACELATYLSLIAHGRGTFDVCLADYNIDFGDVISTLDFDPNGNNMSHWNDDIRERIDNGENPEDITYTKEEIAQFIQKNATDGLNALIAPITNEDSMRISDVELEIMMKNLINNGGFDYVVFDTGNNTRDSSFLALEYADVILLVLTQNVATANCNVGFLNTFQKMGYDLDKVYTVINKVKSAKSVGISTQELEEAFVDQKTNRILTCLSHIKDSNDVRKSYNLAEPLVYNAAHEFTKDIGKIASFVIGDNFALEAPEKETFVKRIFGRKKK